MDSRDVSDVSGFAAHLKMLQAAAERASRRQGQLVRDHPAPGRVIFDFMMNLRLTPARSRLMGTKVFQTATSQVPTPYFPCVRSSSELQPMMIADMRLETHHRGTKTLLRVLTPATRITAVMAIVEDEQGTAVLLQLYNQPDDDVVPHEEIMQPDRVCIVKEAFFKSATNGSYSLRVDHVSDIIWLDDTDQRVPPRWRKPALIRSSVSKDIRTQGNSAVAKQNWAEARRLYSSAVEAAETPEESQLAYLNRSLTNLRLGRPREAMRDAISSGDPASPSDKQLFREARALYELGDFQSTLQKLQTLAASYPHNDAVEPELNRVRARLREQRAGEYNFGRMYAQARATPPLVDCATFSAPVEVRKSPGRGRGLFTTTPVSAGQLLVCEKAFAYRYAADDAPADTRVLVNMTTKRITVGGQAHLLTQVVQKLYHDPQLLPVFVDLYSGSYEPASVFESDGLPVVDSFLVERIIDLTSFGAPRTSRTWFTDRFSGGFCKDEKPPDYTTCGIWVLASRINHSCVGNCRRSFIGDMQIIRATRDLDAGTELLFCYVPPVTMDSYGEAQKRLRHWNFTCACSLCTLRKATPAAALVKRKRIHRNLKDALGGVTKTDEAKAQRLIRQLGKTYVATGAIRMELWEPCFALGSCMLANNRPAEAAKMTIRALEALGYTVVTSPSRLEVTRWGIVDEHTPRASFDIYMAYKAVAPELCPAAKQLVETVYSMVVGEKDSIRDAFPELV